MFYLWTGLFLCFFYGPGQCQADFQAVPSAFQAVFRTFNAKIARLFADHVKCITLQHGYGFFMDSIH